jgi:UDP-glucose 4-epimerase
MEAFYQHKKVLVTGGCGFIGSHLAQRLVSLGADVTILDDLTTGSLDNIASIRTKINLIIASITDLAICEQATNDKDIIFHLAAFISVPQSVEQPLRCHKVNINGTAYLLEAARINGVDRFIFSSSSSVYGSTQGKMAQETDVCMPTSPYGMSKYVGELYCQQYSQHYQLKSVCLRYFNVYGSRQDPNGPYAAVVAKFTHNMQHNLSLTICGDGTQTRDFISVHDVVTANISCSMLEEEHMNGQPFNIATGNSISILELVEQLKRQFPHYTAPITFSNPRAGDPHYSHADCSKYLRVVLKQLTDTSVSLKQETVVNS